MKSQEKFNKRSPTTSGDSNQEGSSQEASPSCTGAAAQDLLAEGIRIPKRARTMSSPKSKVSANNFTLLIAAIAISLYPNQWKHYANLLMWNFLCRMLSMVTQKFLQMMARHHRQPGFFAPGYLSIVNCLLKSICEMKKP